MYIDFSLFHMKGFFPAHMWFILADFPCRNSPLLVWTFQSPPVSYDFLLWEPSLLLSYDPIINTGFSFFKHPLRFNVFLHAVKIKRQSMSNVTLWFSETTAFFAALWYLRKNHRKGRRDGFTTPAFFITCLVLPLFNKGYAKVLAKPQITQRVPLPCA